MKQKDTKHYVKKGLLVIVIGIVLNVGIGIVNNQTSSNYIANCRNDVVPPPKIPYWQNTPTPTPDETANWKTYRNEDMKVSFSYPTDWFLITDESNRVQIISTNPQEAGNWAGFSIQTTQYRTLFTDQTFMSVLENNFLGHRERSDLMPLEVDGMSAYKLEPDAIPENLSMTDIFFYRYGTIYSIRMTEDVGFPERNERKINNHILSTFRFVDNGSNVQKPKTSDEVKLLCEQNNGTFLYELNEKNKYVECENISEQACVSAGGGFNDCASQCRHESVDVFCAQVCVPVCSF